MNSEDERQMDADELAERVNAYLGNVNEDDKRFALLTKRRILDYTTKGLLKKPFKNGNKNYYTDEHFAQLVSLRELQGGAGVSEKTLLRAVASTPTEKEDDFQAKALSILDSFNPQGAVSKSDEMSGRILKNIGSEYLSSSLSGASTLNNVKTASAQNVSMFSRGLDDQIKFGDNQELKFENTQRNQKGVLMGQLNNQFFSSDKVYDVLPGLKVVLNAHLQLDEKQQEIVKEFIDKMVKAYSKTTDGS